MKKVILDKETNEILLSQIPESQAIISREHGILKGMIMKEPLGWILRIVNGVGANGFHSTRKKCIESCLKPEREFFTE